MDANILEKRIEILKEIDLLQESCNCQPGRDRNGCPSCRKLESLGTQLLKLVSPRKVGIVDIREAKVTSEKPSNRIEWTPEMKQFVIDNAEKHTCEELSEKLSVTPKQLQSRCTYWGVSLKKTWKIYEFYENDVLVTTGNIAKLSRELGINESSLRMLTKKKVIKNRKMVLIS